MRHLRGAFVVVCAAALGILGTSAGYLVDEGGTYAYFTASTSNAITITTATHFPSSDHEDAETSDSDSSRSGDASSDETPSPEGKKQRPPAVASHPSEPAPDSVKPAPKRPKPSTPDGTTPTMTPTRESEPSPPKQPEHSENTTKHTSPPTTGSANAEGPSAEKSQDHGPSPAPTAPTN